MEVRREGREGRREKGGRERKGGREGEKEKREGVNACTEEGEQ